MKKLLFALACIAVAAFAEEVLPENLLGKNIMQSWQSLPADKLPVNVVVKGGAIPGLPGKSKVDNENKNPQPPSVFERDETVLFQGKPTIKISSEDAGNVTYLRFWDIALDPDTKYLLRLTVRGDKIKDGAPFFVVVTGAKGNGIWDSTRQLERKFGPGGTFDWQTVEVPVKTRPGDVNGMVDIQFRKGTGTLWVGNIELIEAE